MQPCYRQKQWEFCPPLPQSCLLLLFKAASKGAAQALSGWFMAVSVILTAAVSQSFLIPSPSTAVERGRQ